MQMPKGNILQLIGQFSQFKEAMKGKDPYAIINSLIGEGKITKQQADEALSMANQLQHLFK